MKITGLVLAAVSLIISLVLAIAVWDMSGKLAQATSNHGSDVVKAQSAMDKTAEAIKGLEQNTARLSAESAQNATAIDDMKKRINRMIDLMK